MFYGLIGGFIGCMTGISMWVIPDVYKALKRRKAMNKMAKQRLFEEEIRGIVINEIKRLYNGENNKSKEE